MTLGTVDLNGGWKLFVSDRIPFGSWVCMLTLKALDQSLCLLQVYALNTTSEYPAFVDEVNDALLQVSPTESTVLMGDFKGGLHLK